MCNFTFLNIKSDKINLNKDLEEKHITIEKKKVEKRYIQLTEEELVSTPSVPQYLVAMVYSNWVNLTWIAPSFNGSSAITSYNIYKSLMSSSGYSILDTVSEATFTYNDSSVSKGKFYYYIVKAMNIEGESEASNEVSAEIPTTAPSAPKSLKLDANFENKSVILKWSVPDSDGGTPIKNYYIYTRTSNSYHEYAFGSYGFSYVTTNTTYSYFIDTNYWGPNITFYYIVTAVNNVGESKPSNEVSIISPPTVPDPPSVGSSYNSQINNQVNLNWQVPINDGCSPIMGYNIYRSTTSDSGYQLLKNVPNDTFSYTDTLKNVVIGQEYFYVITALNNIGESGFSNQINITIMGSYVSIKSTPGYELLYFIIIIVPVTILEHRRNLRSKKVNL